MKNKHTQHKNFIINVKNLVGQMQSLHLQAIDTYTPIVNELIQRQCNNQKEIERVLDGLLDFASDERILNLFRKLCRYYYQINPQATANYIQYYKKQYDENEELLKSGYFKKNPIK